MARPKAIAKKVRLNLELSPTAQARLLDLQKRTDADSRCEVVRRALELYDTLLTELQAGAKVTIARPDQPAQVLRLL